MTSDQLPAYDYFNRPCARALYQALIQDDPFYLTLEARAGHAPEQAREAMYRYMDYAMAEARAHGELVLAPDNRSGAAIWACPLAPETVQTLSAQKKAFIRKHLGEESLLAYARMVGFQAEQSRPIIPETAWYLSILGVDPAAQGKGWGRTLVQSVLDKADRLGVLTWLESFTPRNFGFYEHLGFRVVKTALEPLTRTEYAIMVRHP